MKTSMSNLIITSLIILLGMVVYKYYKENSNLSNDELFELGSKKNSPKSLQMYYNIDKFSNEYDVPKHIAYNISYMETRYRGPYDWQYESSRSSPSGALGPMQIMISTSRKVNKESISTSKLKNDIQYNVETSMKLLHLLYEKYNSWEKACGAYNTGRPIVNSYAKFCVNNLNYKNNWIKYE